MKVFSYKYNVAKSQGFPERANYFNFRINSMVGINSLSRGSIPKVTENLIQNITDSFSSDQIQGMTEFLQNIANATTSTDLGINSDTYASNARTIVNGVTYQRVNESNYWTPIE